MRYKRSEAQPTKNRPSKLRVGLRQGFGPGRPIYNIEYAAELFLQWNRERAVDGWPYLPCDVLPGSRLYAWGSGENAVADIEPIAVFDGEVSPFLDDVSDYLIKLMLEEVGEWMADKLGQERVEIVYRDERWAMVPDDSPDPDAISN